MIHQLRILPSGKFILAFSGGVDSAAIAHFYKNGNKNFSLAYFNHGTPQANDMQLFCQTWANKYNIELNIGTITSEKSKQQSPEEYWRDQRYTWLNSFNLPIITCHHLDDVIETWIFSSLHGQSKLIKQINGNTYRPFLLNRKQELINWCNKHQISFFHDKSNDDVKFPRNRIRHNIVSEAFKVNPGLDTVLRKKLLNINKEVDNENCRRKSNCD